MRIINIHLNGKRHIVKTFYVGLLNNISQTFHTAKAIIRADFVYSIICLVQISGHVFLFTWGAASDWKTSFCAKASALLFSIIHIAPCHFHQPCFPVSTLYREFIFSRVFRTVIRYLLFHTHHCKKIPGAVFPVCPKKPWTYFSSGLLSTLTPCHLLVNTSVPV